MGIGGFFFELLLEDVAELEQVGDARTRVALAAISTDQRRRPILKKRKIGLPWDDNKIF